jgi:hypothetical protein
MAKLKATPKNFAEAVEVLQDRISMRLGNNTYLEVSDPDPLRGFIGVRLHNTYIVKFWPDGQVTLHTGGYHTVTTKDRLNEFIAGRVYQKAHQWYYVAPVQAGPREEATYAERTQEFYEGIEVQA